MKIPLTTRRQRRREEALAWLARLQRGLREREGPQLLEWLKPTVNRADITRAAAQWSGPEALAVLAEIFPIDSRLLQPKRRHSAVIVVIAAALAAGVLVSPFFAGYRPGDVYATGPGAGRRMQLEDGTLITLNAATQIVVSYYEHVRVVQISYGEASFAVKPESHRPFHLRAAGRDLETDSALFDVRVAAANSLELTVLTGTAIVFRAPPPRPEAASTAGQYDRQMFENTAVGPLETLQMTPHSQSGSRISETQARAQLAWQRDIPAYKSRKWAILPALFRPAT